MTDPLKSRPRTLWFGKNTAITPAIISSVSARVNSAQVDSRNSLLVCVYHEQDPWSMYEPRAQVFPGRQVTLAQHQVNKQDFVNVQYLHIN
jgi:hypothetical protein